MVALEEPFERGALAALRGSDELVIRVLPDGSERKPGSLTNP